LDGGLFVNAKHHRVLRRFDVQPDNIRRLGLKVGVVGSHVAFDPMGFKPGAPPHPRHHHMANAQVPGRLAAIGSSTHVSQFPELFLNVKIYLTVL